jgi:hypothetical protein
MRKAPKIMLLRTQLNQLWLAALQHDGIEPGAKFVVLSKDNPFMPEYRKLMKEFLRLKKARQIRANRKAAIESLGMKEVRGALGGRYIE